MLKIRKYIALFLVFLPLLLFRFIANNFIIENGTEIYKHVPAEADVIIEVNTRNFIKEIAFQRFFNEKYFMDKIEPQDVEPLEVKQNGINFFNSMVIFRETWATEKVWAIVVAYLNEEDLQRFADENFPENSIHFSDDGYAIIQLSSSENYDAVDDHFKSLAEGSIKPIIERVDLEEKFNGEKEINFYFSPATTNPNNQIIDGVIALDFLGDYIDISGYFTPISGFNENKTIAYSPNNDAAFQIRSALNLFHSVYWFGNQKIENLPQYSQLAFDYNGMELLLCDYKALGLEVPFRSIPDMQIHVDLLKPDEWKNYMDTLSNSSNFIVDTTTHTLKTKQGAELSYVLNNAYFELSNGKIDFSPATEDSLYLYMSLDAEALFDNTLCSVDAEHPPKSQFEEAAGKAIADNMIDEIHEVSMFSTMEFMVTKRDQILGANGRINMKNTGGQSMIECLYIGTAALMLLQDY